MNKWVAMGIGAAVGGGVGYVVGYLIAERMNRQEEEAEGVWEEGQPEEETAEDDKDEEPSSPTPQRKERDIVTGPRRIVDYNKLYEEKPDLAALAARYNGVDNEPAKVMVSTVVKPEVKIDPDAPRILTEEEFDATEAQEDYRYLVLTYYAGDDVLVAPNSVPIMEPEKVVGPDALTAFGSDPDQDADTVYVINSRIGGIYEINRIDDFFGEPKESKIVYKNIFDKED